MGHALCKYQTIPGGLDAAEDSFILEGIVVWYEVPSESHDISPQDNLITIVKFGLCFLAV